MYKYKIWTKSDVFFLTVTTSFVSSEKCFPDVDFGFVYCDNCSIIHVCICVDHVFLPFPMSLIYLSIFSFSKYVSSVHCFSPIVVDRPCELDWIWSQVTDKLSAHLGGISLTGGTEMGQLP